MWDFLVANQKLLITLGTLIGGYLFHQHATTTKQTDNGLIASALGQVASLFDSYVASVSTDTALATMRIELRGLAAVEMGKLGIYEGTTARALIDAGVSMAIESAIARFVTRHPDPKALHAEVKQGTGLAAVVA